MPADIIDISVTTDQLKEAELAVRQSVATYGAQHADVLLALEIYIELLRGAGDVAQAEKLSQRADLLRENLNKIATGQVAAPDVRKPSSSESGAASGEAKLPGAAASSQETHLFSSFGHHVATVYEDNIYTPEGKNIGRFAPDLEVFLNLDGRYMGQIVEENRLALDTNWQFRHINFGMIGDSGSRAGWGRQADIGRCILPRDFEDVKLELE